MQYNNYSFLQQKRGNKASTDLISPILHGEHYTLMLAYYFNNSASFCSWRSL